VGKPNAVRFNCTSITSSAEVQSVLDYEGKIDRGSAHIGLLIEDGRKQAREFLKARARMVALQDCERIGVPPSHHLPISSSLR
jgi:hypothetical protein